MQIPAGLWPAQCGGVCSSTQEQSSGMFLLKTYVCVCVSHVGEMLVLAWQVAMFNVADGKMAFLVTDATIANAEPKWLNPLQLDDYDVIPTEVVSPLGLWVANARQVHDKSAVVFLQTKDPMDVMQWAAENCFWKIPESKLRIIAKELEIHPPSPDLLGYLTILLHNYFPGASPEDINNYLRLRTQVREDALEKLLQPDVMEHLFPTDDMKAVEEFILV